MKVAQAMTTRVVHVYMDTSLKEIGDIFAQRPFFHLPVLDEDNRFAGFVSLVDYQASTTPFLNTPAERNVDRELLKKPAHQVMTRQVPTLTPEQDLVSAAKLLLENHYSCLPVVDGEGQLLGVLSWKDVMRIGIAQAERLPADSFL